MYYVIINLILISFLKKKNNMMFEANLESENLDNPKFTIYDEDKSKLISIKDFSRIVKYFVNNAFISVDQITDIITPVELCPVSNKWFLIFEAAVEKEKKMEDMSFIFKEF
jgi:hypothetical protein